MGNNFTVQIRDQFDTNAFVSALKQQLNGMGYEVQDNFNMPVYGAPNMDNEPVGPRPLNLTVSKDNDGFKKFIGLGLECSVSIMPMGTNMLSVSVESSWGNKVLALVIGWFLCMIPFITGLVGCVSQSEMPKKIQNAVQSCAYNS